jgi:peptide-methionine (R)-S-oxide reductase
MAGCGRVSPQIEPAGIVTEEQKPMSETKFVEQHDGDHVPKTEAEWRQKLTPEQYHVLREKGTERAFAGKYWNQKEDGTYTCAACGAELFKSSTKFDSGCGWPSFYDVADKKTVKFHDDDTLGMHRIEVTCARCGGHLGHVFDDGPAPTGQRYCINSASLNFHKSPAK